MGQLACIRFAARDHPIKLVSLLTRQRHPIPLRHARLLPPVPFAADRFQNRQNKADKALGPVEDHRKPMTVAARWIMAVKL
jgi:hypothetical protein